jgi:hypothetical protein
MVSTNWITNVLYQSDVLKPILTGKVVQGYVQELVLDNGFSMTLNMEEQLKALHKIPEQRRVIHFDATGNLVKICQNQHKYPQLLTYGMIAQDLDNLHEDKYVLVSETTTSNDDTKSISKMFLNLLIDFQTLYKSEKRLCRLLVTDLSWASIHAACKILNNETFVEYNNRIFQMANGDTSVDLPNKVLLASCASHTMKIFTRALRNKRLFQDSDTRNFSIHCFSLMLDCTNLETISNIFKLICICFTSKNNDYECDKARKSLELLIEEKTEYSVEINKQINEVFSMPILQNNAANNNSDISEEDEDNENENLKEQLEQSKFIKPRKMLQNDSLFNDHFLKILENITTRNIAEDAPAPINPIANEKFINLLMQNFMPYCGIWAGLVYNNLEIKRPITRITNGIIEKYWQYRKRNSKSVIVCWRSTALYDVWWRQLLSFLSISLANMYGGGKPALAFSFDFPCFHAR